MSGVQNDLMSDEEPEMVLVMLAQRGDLRAFEKLLRRLHSPLRKYITRLVGVSAADDILQDAALRIFQHLNLLREARVFKAWSFRIATRIAFVHLKREKRWRETEREYEETRSIQGNSTPPVDLDEDFLGLLDCVSPSSRAVLLLHYQQHLSLEETAAILDIPLGTVKSRLSYGVSTIRNSIKERK